jgi:putative ABC transport system permease protein
VLNKLVVENLKHRPVRTGLSILAIGVEVTMMLTLVGLSHGTLNESARRARGVGADVIVRPPGTSVISLSSAPMPDKLLGFFEQQSGVDFATGTMIHPLGGLSTITGVDLEAFRRMNGGFRYLEGGPFANPNDLLIDEYYARQNNLKVGSEHEVMNQKWRVAGIVESGKLARLVVQLPVLQDLTGNSNKLSQIYLKVQPGTPADQVVADLRSKLTNYHIYTMEEFTSMLSINNVGMLREFIYVVIAISVVVGFIVVFMAMYTAVLERTREIGILKALGASPGYVLNILFRETLLLAVVGSVVGILMTFGTRWLLHTAVPAALTQEIVPAWWPIAGGIAVTGALLGTIYPGWKAAKQDAIEALAYE